MSDMFEFMRSINELTEKIKSLNVSASPLQISKVINDSSFQNSLINATKINDSIISSILLLPNVMQKNNQSFALPKSTIDSISQLIFQQEKINRSLFVSLSAINSISISLNEVNKIKNLNIAFTSLSTELAKLASTRQNWKIIEDFEDLTSEAITLSEQSTNDYDSTTVNNFSDEFKSFLGSVEEFYLKYKEAGIILLFIIDVILRFAGLHQYYDFIKDKSKSATKSEINEVKNSQITILKNLEDVRQQISKKDKLSYTNKNCQIRLKPNSRSTIINNLTENYEIIVVKIQPTWLLINYTDPKDGLPQTGWINKNDIK